MRIRISLLYGLKPDEIRMLLWWADESERKRLKQEFPDKKYEPKYTVTAIALRHGLQRDEVNKVIRGYKNKKIEKIVFDAIKPYFFEKNSINLKQQYQQRKISKQKKDDTLLTQLAVTEIDKITTKPNDCLLTRISKPPKKKKERKTRAFSSGYNSAVECEYLCEFLNYMRIERNYSDTTITTYRESLTRYLIFLNDRSSFCPGRLRWQARLICISNPRSQLQRPSHPDKSTASHPA